MAQPSITGTPPILKFGNQALPNGQGTMPYINLNDVTSWFWQDIHGDLDYLQHGVSQVAFAGKGAYLSFDAKSRILSCPMIYSEAVNPLGAALAALSQSGEQMITTDNSSGILARFAAATGRNLRRKYAPYWWDLTLEFLCKTPWFQDLTATTFAPVAVSGSTGAGTTTTISTLTYAGSVFCEPVWTLVVPVGNTVVINSMVLTNSLSGEALTIVFPGGLLATTAYNVVIDTGALTVVDTTHSVAYDFSGSFPRLYPSGQVAVGQLNTHTCKIVTASGTTTSVTLGAVYTPRWEL